MKTQNAFSTEMVGLAANRKLVVQRILLACGIFSSVLYLITDNLATTRWADYSAFSQTVSELIAVDAPTRPLVVPLFTLYALLIYAFGFGIWYAAGQKRALRIAACLIIAKELLGLGITLFAPIHLRGVEGTISDSMHGILTAVGVFLCMFPAMGFGAAALGKKFRVYSIVTMLIFVVFGVWTGLMQPLLVADLPTPWMGVFERINIYGYLLWIAVLAILLLRGQSEPPRLEG